MDERVMRFRVGVMFLATLLITAIMLVMFGKLPKLIGTYPVEVRFDYAAGVTNYTPVRKSGILIGRVAGVRLVDTDSKVLITADIQSDKTIYQNEDCYITRDLLGDTAMIFMPNPRKRGAGEPIVPGTVLEGQVSDDPTGLKKALEGPINTVSDTGEALTAASKRLEKAAESVEKILDEKTQADIKDILSDAADSLKTIRTALGDKENREKLSDAMKKLPKTLDSMSGTFEAADKILNEFNERSPKDGKTPIERMVGTIEVTERTLRKFTDPPSEGESAPADQIATAMENIGEITTLMRSIMARIERGEGSLGALMNDRQLYDRLSRAAKNIEEVSFQLKPVIADARIFMDKAARHPGVFIREAVKPGVGIK